MKIYFLLIAALLTISTGCKKEKNKKPACRINRLITPAGKEIKVTYNADGKYAKIENGGTGETTTPVYSSNSIVITRVNTGTGILTSRSTYLLNSSGMIYSSKTEYYTSTGTIVKSSLKSESEYNGLQLIKATTIDSFYSDSYVSIKTADYTWREGNFISIFLAANGTPYGKADYEYYTDKLFQQADIQSIGNLIGGYDINLSIKNKNLTKKQGSDEYVYEFDTEGKIKSIYKNGNIIYLIEYECN